MSTQSPQRSRRTQPHPSTQVTMHNLPPRETSPSPTFRDRPRAIKTMSMPLVPSVMQIFAAANPGQPASQAQQSSPTTSNPSNPSRRSPPPPTSQVPPRHLPTPPPTNAQAPSPERRVTSPPPQHSHSQSTPNAHTTHYPRPINRVPPPHFLNKFHGMDENWQMTDELLAEIERADLQQSQGQGYPVPSYLPGYDHAEPGSASKDPVVERVRASERSSPKDGDGGQQRRQRDQQAPRESPNTRDRQPTSPTASSFAQAQAQPHTPERRVSPPYHTPLGSPGEHSANYQYKRDSPPVLRRGSNAANPESRSTLSSQTPPLQAINARTPDRSLPVQEEPEDDIAFASKNDTTRNRDTWKAAQHGHAEHEQRMGSPTPSSDLHPDGHVPRYDAGHSHSGRGSRAGHREDDDDTLIEEEAEKHRSAHDRDRADEEGGYTPRSPTAGLPDDAHDRYYPAQNLGARAPVRGRTRAGPTDQLGLRGFDPAVFDQGGKITTMGAHDARISDRPPQYAEQRGPVQKGPQQQQQPQQQQPQQQQPQYQHHPQHYNDGRTSTHGHYYRPQIHPEDLQNFLDDPAAAYIHAYLQSPRPYAPVPPTPHSQTAAPSPSPLISGMYSEAGTRDLPPFTPVRPIGSPYPYPFSHVRRNQSYTGHPSRPPLPSTYDPNHPTVIQEQLAKQWQVYAQNNHGHVSDSTFSPSSTPFQGGGGYNPWASLHTNRILGGRVYDPTSLQSSPSHEPVPLPPPPSIGLKKKDRSANLRATPAGRKPPPRVDSTQPRETSPEPSSSGEETAGEETFAAVVEEGGWVNGAQEGDWVDEDEEADDEDLLELEFHPSFVCNVEKRRRRWETRWEALNQAFQALDRQTDATLVLLAAPSHSTKLHVVTSRSIRRNRALGRSAAMSGVRAGFRQVAGQRRSTRTQKASLVDRLLVPSGSSDGSDGSSESREEDLNRLMGGVLGGLGALGSIYEQREARWNEEMRRISEDRERVELLLRQIIGENHPPVGQAL